MNKYDKNNKKQQVVGVLISRTGLGLVAATLLIAGCSHYGPYHWWTVSDYPVYLHDCSESISAEMAWDMPDVPELDRKRLVQAASAWAVDNCFAPCDYKMCATITEYGGGSGTVYVSNDISAPGANESDSDAGPSAYVVFNLESFDVRRRGIWKSGCRNAAVDCEANFD